ncbi:unnamed protein product [Adineta steineri]|uniref:F-box domain-containing protein n=1 Tax=Adineta steineri TaxID=433720 RepID=A0A814UWK8_9BILA|nr:unnamed protein product [Adineta steineri]CAF1456174.1 unnamed protein product [Adineta steineri]
MSKKNKGTMNLELLPNEILLGIFQYLHGVDLLRAFYDLNYRFNFLLHNQHRAYCFNFNHLSKRTFDMICQQHLTFIADRTTTLALSNGENTPEQIHLFFKYIPSFDKFIHLRSLSLRHLDIDTAFILLDGYEWKEVIQNWLSNLRVFKLEMMAVLPEKNVQKEADELFATFQTSFWTVEHQCFQEKLQALFDLALNLRRVRIYQDEPLPSYMSIFKCECASVRELCLRFDELGRNHYFNQADCVTLARAPLGVQCEVLSISVTNRENIIYLVENLTNLYSLDVVCKDDEYWKTLVGEKNDDELVQWLKDRLPSTNLITRYPNFGRVIRIWI